MIPLLVGAAAVGAVGSWLLSDDKEDSREKSNTADTGTTERRIVNEKYVKQKFKRIGRDIRRIGK
ncbi:MAG: hypothetical protein IJU91_01910 [Selenomonadaceae bacterium]|nr:hypothetical protein [Selenomonadaceae bacterium]